MPTARAMAKRSESRGGLTETMFMPKTTRMSATMIWDSIRPKRRMPRSNSVSGGRRASRSAIRPNAVPAPVWATRTAAVPLRTVVPMKTQFVRSARPASGFASPGAFSTGKVSPVSTAWLTKKSLASRTRPSAGMRLPADRSMTSPGTISSAGTDRELPSRSTEILCTSRARSFSTAREAVYS